MKRLQSTGSVACVLGVLIAWGCGNEAPSTDNTQTNTTGASGNTTASATNGGSASAGTTATTGGGNNTVSTGTDTTTGSATTTSGVTSSSTSSGTTTSSGNSGSTTTGTTTTSTSGSTTTGNSGSTTTGNSGSTTTGSSSTTTGTTTSAGSTTGSTTTGSDGGRGTTTGGRGTSTGTTGTTGTTTGTTTTTSGGGDGGASINITMGTSNLDGYLFQYTCGSSHSGYDCANTGCTGNQVTKTTTFMVGGTAGTVYNMNFRVRGIVEGYQYKNGTRDQGTTSQNANPDLFYQGGAPQASGADGYDYNTYEVDVAPAVAGAPNVYFLNSTPGNPHTDTTLQHLTFAIDFTKTIKITGGGTITFKVFDSNCTQVMNCGPAAGSSCAAPRTVMLTGANPAPTNFTQPFQMPTGAYGQWIYFDILGIQ